MGRGHPRLRRHLSARGHRLPRPPRHHRPGRRPRPADPARLSHRRVRAASRSPKRATPPASAAIPNMPRPPIASATARWSRPRRCYDYDPRSTAARPRSRCRNALGLRPVAICHRAADAPRARRQAGAGQHRLQEGLPEGRQPAALPLRLWRLRLRHPAELLLGPPEPARPRLRLRHRPHPRRRRHGLRLVSRRHRDQPLEHLPRFRRRRERPQRRGLRQARQDRHPGRLGRRQADGRGGQHRSRRCGAR